MELWQIDLLFMLTLIISILTFRNGYDKGYLEGRNSSMADSVKNGHIECIIYYRPAPKGFKNWAAFMDECLRRREAGATVLNLVDYKR